MSQNVKVRYSSGTVCIDINGLLFTDVSIADILHFVSGATKLPATGFATTPSIRFCNVDAFPVSSTCDVSITIPRSLGLLSYADFKKTMDMSIFDMEIQLALIMQLSDSTEGLHG